MKVESIWKPSFEKEAQLVYKTEDRNHPAVNFLFQHSNPVYLGGVIEKIRMPNHYDFQQYRLSPSEVKKNLRNLDGQKPLHSKLEIHCIELTLK